MALPDGITTCTVTAGVPVTHTGAPVKAFVSIEPSVFLVHTATGTPLVDFLEELSINEGVAGQFTLPHTDQPGFQDENGNAYTNWYYTARISYSTPSKAKTKAPKIKVFQLAAGQTVVDLDALPGGAPALPYTAPIATVTSLNGRTGPVELLDADLPERLSEAELSATYIQHVTSLGQADESARLNGFLAASANKTLRLVGTFNINAPLVVPTGCTLDLRDATLAQTAGPMRNMIVNAAYGQSRTLNTLGITSGSTSITSSVATFTAGDVGKSIRLYLGDNGGPRFLSTTITSVTSPTVAVLAAAPTATMAITGASIGTRDEGIRILGGTLKRYASAWYTPSDNNFHTVLIRRCDNLVIDGLRGGGGVGKYMIFVGDVTDFNIKNATFDAAPSDGVHIGGWSFRGTVENITGWVGDDIVAITAADYLTYNDCAGDVSDIQIRNVALTGSTAPSRILVCSDATGTTQTHIKVRRVDVDSIGTRGHRSTNNEYLGRILLTGELEDMSVARTDRQIVIQASDGGTGHGSLNTLRVRDHRNRFDGVDSGITVEMNVGRIEVDGVNPLWVNGTAGYYMIVGRSSSAVEVGAITIKNARADFSAVTAAFRLVSFLYPNAVGRSVTVETSAILGSGSDDRVVDCATNANMEKVTFVDVDTTGTQWDISHGGTGACAVSLVNSRLRGLSPIRLASTGSVTLSAMGTAMTAHPALNGTGTIKADSLGIARDVALFSKVAGALMTNVNAARSCGVGPVYCDGTTWTNLATGATYTP